MHHQWIFIFLALTHEYVLIGWVFVYYSCLWKFEFVIIRFKSFSNISWPANISSDFTTIDWMIVPLSLFFMPPPLGAGGIMFSGCPSVRPSVRSLKYPLLTCTLVHWSTRPTVTVLRHVCPSVCPSVRLKRFPGICRWMHGGIGLNFTCWCILTIFRTD